jgi:hypothetical protein
MPFPGNLILPRRHLKPPTSILSLSLAVPKSRSNGTLVHLRTAPMPQRFPGLDPRQAITYEDHLPSGSSDFEVAQAPLSVPHPDTNLPQAPPPPLPLPSGLSPRSVRPPANPGIACSHTTCSKTFTRDADRIRHESQVHRSQPGLHVCPIIGCPKSQGKGYSRADKVVEHLWKKHGDLGFIKG